MNVKQTSMLTGQVVRHGLSYFLLGGMQIKNGHLPLKNHHIPHNFFGVCAASNVDPAVDDYVITQVKALGIKQVRLDFSYGDLGNNKLSNFNARFLTALIDANLEVTLHLVQPFAAAKNMQNASEQGIWRIFLQNVLDTFGQQIKQIEIGTTINRKRWAGYTFEGFLSAWEIAHTAITARNIVLIGPNIQDFEPFYNISLLKIFKHKNLLPTIHSNNLFSERTVEPERFDHRIFKYHWATCFKVNLIKKARIIQKIGADFDTPKLVSSAAFWAMFRIRRLLPDVEQKQADYAARYLVLMAASGSLQQVNWGALICAREGLIDNGLADSDYPALEQVTHYPQANGALKNYRHYPSFDAVKTVVNFLQGSHYIQAVSTANGLEIHHFIQDTKHIHVAWCINGKAYLTHDIYGDALRGAQILARSGTNLARNNGLITESPIYMQFDTAPILRTNWQATATPNLVIHAHASQQYFPVEMDGWQGLVLADNQDDAQKLIHTINPNQLQAPQKGSHKDRALRHARNAIWTVADPRDNDKQLTIKQPVKMYPHKALLDQFKPSKAKRSWNGAMELMRRGISTAAPVAYFEKIGDKTLKQNFYLCDFMPAEITVGQLFNAFSSGEAMWKNIAKDDILKQVAQFCLNMHQHLVFFRDLSGGNILVNVGVDNQLQFSLIDTARLRCIQHTPFPRQYRLADMTRACHKLDWPNRQRLMAFYFAGIGSSFSWRDKLSFYLYDFKVGLKRKIGRKGIKRLMSRFKNRV